MKQIGVNIYGKDQKGITKAAATALLCGAVLFATGTTCQAAGETYDTAMEAAYGDTFRSVYENRLAGSPLEAEAADGVDTATGHLMLSRTDLSLEGTGGMDFELNRYYDSNEANLGHATVEYIEDLEVDTLWVYYTASDGSQRRIVVNAAVLKNHKNALKNLLVKYEKGAGWKGVSLNGKSIMRKTPRERRLSVTRDITYMVWRVAGGMISRGSKQLR